MFPRLVGYHTIMQSSYDAHTVKTLFTRVWTAPVIMQYILKGNKGQNSHECSGMTETEKKIPFMKLQNMEPWRNIWK